MPSPTTMATFNFLPSLSLLKPTFPRLLLGAKWTLYCAFSSRNVVLYFQTVQKLRLLELSPYNGIIFFPLLCILTNETVFAAPSWGLSTQLLLLFFSKKKAFKSVPTTHLLVNDVTIFNQTHHLPYVRAYACVCVCVLPRVRPAGVCPQFNSLDVLKARVRANLIFHLVLPPSLRLEL